MILYKNGPLVTIAMVTYNSSKYVRKAIESVLDSTYENFELIISDDNSTDGTWEIVNSFSDSRILKIRNVENVGEYTNRNNCIDLAKGEYFLFIDGDDVITPHGLDVYMTYALKFPEIPLIIEKGYFNNIIFPDLLEPHEIFKFHDAKVGLLNSSFSSNLFRTSYIKQNKLSIKYFSGDDDIRLKIASVTKVLFISGWLTWPRETPGQASAKINPVCGIAEQLEMFQEIRNIGQDSIQDFILKKLIYLRYHLLKAIVKNLVYKGGFVTHSRMNKKIDFNYFDSSIIRIIRDYINSEKSAEIKYNPDKPLVMNKYVD